MAKANQETIRYWQRHVEGFEASGLTREAYSKQAHISVYQLDDIAPDVLPKSLFGTALHYGRQQWLKLVRFLEDGRIEIDDNRSERAIKPFVIGRKNWLFCNTPKGAHASVMIYSIIESAKENRLNHLPYLNYLFERLPNLDSRHDEVDQMLPWNVKLNAVSAHCLISREVSLRQRSLRQKPVEMFWRLLLQYRYSQTV